jgi:hypothetical protein
MVLVAHCAVLLLPLPLSCWAEQPGIEDAPSVKLTLPTGAAPVTVAVKVTLAPTFDGLAELAIDVLLGVLLTTWDSGPLVEAALPASPP